MAKWGYLARAYAIKEYAYYREIQEYEKEGYASQHEMDAALDQLDEVVDAIKFILEMAESVCDSAKCFPYEYRTIQQCRRFLKDFETP